MSLLAGIILGFAAAVPAGPIAILLVTQRIRGGFRRGFGGALAAAGMDVVYSLVAIQAAGFVNGIILRYAGVMKVLGTVVLIAVSVGLFRQSRKFDVMVLIEDRFKKELHPAFSTVLLYLSGPTILAFWLAAAGLVVAHGIVERGHPSAIIFALGCGAGAILWYFILLRFLLPTTKMFSERVFRKIFFILGIILAVVAVANLLSLWFKFPGSKLV